jgi:hypothetical protein
VLSADARAVARQLSAAWRTSGSAVPGRLEQFLCSPGRLGGLPKREALCGEAVVTEKLFAVGDDRLRSGDRRPVATIALVVFDLGPEPEWHKDRRPHPVWHRYAAEVESFPALREVGRSPWEAVSRLVGGHRALLERRWSG